MKHVWFLLFLVLATAVAHKLNPEEHRKSDPKIDSGNSNKFGNEKEKAEKPGGKIEKLPTGEIGALGEGFEIRNKALITADFADAGARIFENIPPDCITITKLRKTTRHDTFYRTTEALYESIGTATSVKGELKGEFTLGASVSAVTNSLSGDNTNVSGLSLDLKAEYNSYELKKHCINNQPLTAKLEQTFKSLESKITNPHFSSSWERYRSFFQTFGTHIVSKAVSGSSIFQYVFAKSSEKFSRYNFTVKACASLAGPTEAGELDVSACTGVSREDMNRASTLDMEKNLVVRGGKSSTRADLTGTLSKDTINSFLKEGETDPAPIRYSFYPIWTILQARYIDSDDLAKALNLEQYYKGFLNFGCPHKKTDNGKEMQKFELDPESSPGAPRYNCMIIPQGCHDPNDCHLNGRIGCDCRGDSCVRYVDKKCGSGVTKKRPVLQKQSGWTDIDVHFCEHNGFDLDLSCFCNNKQKDWRSSWNGDINDALLDVHLKLTEAKRRDQHYAKHPK